MKLDAFLFFNKGKKLLFFAASIQTY